MQDNGFSYAQQRHALFWLVLFHMLIIASSNYLVQFPFTVTLPNGFEVHSTWVGRADLSVYLFGYRFDRSDFRAAAGAEDSIFRHVSRSGAVLRIIRLVPKRHMGRFCLFGRIHTVCVLYRRRQFFGLCGRTDIGYFRVQPAAPPEIVVDCPFFINVCRQCNRHFTFFRHSLCRQRRQIYGCQLAAYRLC